jgi:hypothetical protein
MIPYIIGAAVAALASKVSKARRAQGKGQITEQAQNASSDWQGNMWDRLAGRDLVAKSARNRTSHGHPNMAPSTVDLARHVRQQTAAGDPRHAKQHNTTIRQVDLAPLQHAATRAAGGGRAKKARR